MSGDCAWLTDSVRCGVRWCTLWQPGYTTVLSLRLDALPQNHTPAVALQVSTGLEQSATGPLRCG